MHLSSCAPESRFVLLSLQVGRPISCRITHPGFPTTTRLPLLLQISRLKLKEHIHTTSIYTVVFHLLQNFSARFFVSFCCVVTAYYTSHERLMILNLACFKAFCSSWSCWASRRRRREVKPRRRRRPLASSVTNGLRLPKHYFYHNYIYIDSCFIFPFIRFAVVPCSNVSVCSCVFFNVGGLFPWLLSVDFWVFSCFVKDK